MKNELGDVIQTIHPDDEMMRFFQSVGNSEYDYFKSGKQHMRSFLRVIKRFRPDYRSEKKVLDYGSGHGRITRFLIEFLAPSKVVTADVWDEAVKFCSKEFGTIPFVITSKNSISKIGEKFDIIISYSVFSHLPPNSFERNLLELKKSLDSNGLLMFTTHGKYHAKLHDLSLENGYHFGSLGKKPNHTNGRLSGEEYSFMCVTVDFVEKILDKLGLNLVEHISDINQLSKQEMYVVEILK